MHVSFIIFVFTAPLEVCKRDIERQWWAPLLSTAPTSIRLSTGSPKQPSRAQAATTWCSFWLLLAPSGSSGSSGSFWLLLAPVPTAATSPYAAVSTDAWPTRRARARRESRSTAQPGNAMRFPSHGLHASSITRTQGSYIKLK
jgi:hypothetical protein